MEFTEEFDEQNRRYYRYTETYTDVKNITREELENQLARIQLLLTMMDEADQASEIPRT